MNCNSLHTLSNAMQESSLECILEWFDLHLGDLQRVLITGPSVPLHAISVRRVWSAVIVPVEVRKVASFVPPSSSVFRSTVARTRVIVLVERRKLLSQLRDHRRIH